MFWIPNATLRQRIVKWWPRTWRISRDINGRIWSRRRTNCGSDQAWLLRTLARPCASSRTLGAMEIIPREQVLIAGFLVAFDLLGTFVFALSGAVAGIRHRLDLFGVLVLSSAAATAGGLARDVLIGAEMPAAIRDWR